ncbi:MAG: bifunctional pyr operon transcriptional regulator/uracil phosphoribosyltransferase [Candidatus Omnitrophica bacterium CG1_02_49_10]|nr:MAG: bifunctional pyr operon transcriptional regulator/uracil phosphoribosyltransferase [Candidatus Omnitrophica bacterium CG1_02_49_10]
MSFKEKAKILDKENIDRVITRIAHEIVEKNKGAGSLALIGIEKRGVNLARRINGKIKEISGDEVPLGVLDITLYRDDLMGSGEQPTIRKTEIDFDITDKDIVLVDDVLYTGRTIRAAMDALIDLGRPKRIQLAVLIDRGHRELPIRPDYIGKNLPTANDESVQVRLEETDGVSDEVVIGVEDGK